MRGEHRLGANCRIGPPQIIEHRAIEHHGMPMARAARPERSRRSTGRTMGARVSRHARTIAATDSGLTSGTSTSVTRIGLQLRVVDGGQARQQRRQLPLRPAQVLNDARARFEGRHGGANRIDVGTGHHGDAGQSGRQQGGHNPRRPLCLRTYPTVARPWPGPCVTRRRPPGRWLESCEFLSKSANSGSNARAGWHGYKLRRLLDFPLLTCLHWPRFPRPPASGHSVIGLILIPPVSWVRRPGGRFLQASVHRRTGYADRNNRTAPYRQGLWIHSG